MKDLFQSRVFILLVAVVIVALDHASWKPKPVAAKPENATRSPEKVWAFWACRVHRVEHNEEQAL